MSCVELWQVKLPVGAEPSRDGLLAGEIEFVDISDMGLRLRSDFLSAVETLLASGRLKHQHAKIESVLDPRGNSYDHEVLVLGFRLGDRYYRFLFLVTEFRELELVGCNQRNASPKEIDNILRAFIRGEAGEIVVMD